MKYFLGIDMGTSSVKLIAMDESGVVIKKCRRDYSYHQPQPGWKEIWPSVWVEAVEDGLMELVSDLDQTLVAAIGVTGQMHTTVFLDENGECLRPAILWNDMRTKDRILYMKEQLAGHRDGEAAGNIISTGSPAANLFWLKEEEPETFSRLGKFLIGPDYLAYYLSGTYSTDYCQASTSSLYDTEKRGWSQTARTLLSLPAHVYPPVLGSQAVTGYLKETLQRKLGLSSKVKIIAGTGDNPAAAVATGSLQYGYPVLSIGTSGVLVFPREGLRENGKGKQILYSPDGTQFHVLVQGVVQSAGGSFDWYAKKILGVEDFDSLTGGVDVGNLGNQNLLFYPHLNGDKTIYGDPSLRGGWLGLDTNHTREDLAVAVMEGICFAIKEMMEAMELTPKDLGNLGQLKVTGGGSYSPLWMQILADVLNVEIGRIDSGEGPSYGAAILAFMAENGEKMEFPMGQGKLLDCFVPRPVQRKRYQNQYEKYVRIHQAMKWIESGEKGWRE